MVLSVLDFEQNMVLVACGPYTTSDSITYDPLLDLITIINHDRPDVCILVGGPPRARYGRPVGSPGVSHRGKSSVALNSQEAHQILLLFKNTFYS